MVRVIMLMADRGHDPTETATPYEAFKKAGFEISFATETGKTPECDPVMLRGLTQRLIGATASTVRKHDAMALTKEFQHPFSWTAPNFTLSSFDLVFLPGGHEKSIRQILESKSVHKLLAEYLPLTKKPSKKGIGAVCHGVMVLSEAQDDEGRYIMRDCTTTTLPARMEQFVFWSTRLFLGDYFKTYGAGSEDVEVSVVRALADPSQYKKSTSLTPFVVEDPNYNYISARFAVDLDLQGEKLVHLMRSLESAGQSVKAG